MELIGVYFSTSALIILCILSFVFFHKKKIKNIETVMYSKLLVLTLIGLSLEIITCVWYRAGFNIDYYMYKFLSKLTSSYYAVWSILFLNYLFNVCNDKKINKKINITIIVVTLLILLLPIKFVTNGDSIIPQGLSIFLTYFICLVLTVCDVFICIKYRKKIILSKFTPLYALMILGSLDFIIGVLYPQLFVIGYVFSLIVIIMYHTIENPDMKVIEQLNNAKDAAEKANRAKTDFLSSMSHEIRTPLNAIVGFSECILKEEDLESVRSDAKDIIMASQNLLEIVNGILDISKIEADRMEIVETEYNLRENLESLSKLMVPRIGEKPIEFKTKFAPDIPPTLYGDISKIKQIITNILTNAVKYTEKGSINFEVNCINRNTSCSLVISVEDTGRGIPADKIDAIFNKFERLEEDRNTTLEGTGLGLAITKRLVEMMGGKIVVQSKYGEGSKFTVYLKQKIRNSVVKKTSQSFTPIQNRNLSSKKILVVDDNRINLKVATRLLQPLKIQVEECESGEACLSKVRNGNHYDLILMDDMMPKMTGTETLQELRKDSSFHTPVVVLTANAIEGMRTKYLNLGFTDYLAKPIDKSELERVLGQYLSTSVEKDIFGPLPEELFDMNIPLKKDE